MQAQSFRPLLPSSLRSFPGGEFAKPGTCSTQAGQAPKLRAFGGKEYTPSPVFSTCHSEASSPLDRKSKGLGRGARRGPAGDGVLRAPRRQPQWCRPAGADYNSQRALRQPTRLPPQSPIPPPPPPPPFSFGFCLGFSFRKRGGPCGRIAPPSRVTSALESVVCLRPLRHQSGGKRSPAVGTTPEATEKGLM